MKGRTERRKETEKQKDEKKRVYHTQTVGSMQHDAQSVVHGARSVMEMSHSDES